MTAPVWPCGTCQEDFSDDPDDRVQFMGTWTHVKCVPEGFADELAECLEKGSG